MKRVMTLFILLVSIMIFASGCGIFTNGDRKNSEVTIEKDKVEQLELTLNIGAGNLNVQGGADDWVEGTIEYNKNKLKPDVSYKKRADKGIAVIEQDKGLFNNINLGEVKNDWDLQLNNDIPMKLEVNSGASDTNLDLEGLNLTSLEVNAGVGDITIDLSGDWNGSFDASLHMGVGESTIILPKEVGVKIKASKGIGSAEFDGFISKGDGVYVNEAYENADVIINLTTEMGVGEANFQLK